MLELSNPIYTDPEAAREHLEAIQWPNCPVCPHCGNFDGTRITKLEGKSTRPGVYKCKDCRKPFSVTVGTVFERSKVPLNKWIFATHMMCASKKGMSAHQLHRMLGVTYKTAWFMEHRIREAMKEDTSSAGPLGGEGKVIEADETYFGKVALVERSGKARMFSVEGATKEAVREILFTNVPRATTVYTDESRIYMEVGKEYAAHETVNHSAKEYVRGAVHTNTIENVFSVFKRGMKGVYQHCQEKHLRRYLAEFDFRYNPPRRAQGQRQRARPAMPRGHPWQAPHLSAD